MSSGLRVMPRSENPEQSPIKIYWLLEELKKKKIAQKAFAKKLGVSPGVLTGKNSTFPADKVDECMRLLENWEYAPTVAPAGGLKTSGHPWSGPIFSTGKKL
jgi:hypothetical protein